MDYLTHHEYSRLTNTSLGLTPTTYYLSVRFWRFSKVSILVFGFGTLPTPGVFPRKVWTIQSPSISPLYLSSLNGLTEADARSLLGLGRLRVGWVNCCIREHVEVVRCFRCQGYGHVSRGCTLPARKDACWRCGGASHVAKECKASPRCLTCTDRGEKDVAYASGSGSGPICRAELRRLRGGK